jgi:hypothetical protein
MHTVVILEHHISLRLFDTKIGVHGMEDIGELWLHLVPFFPQCDPSYI